jgi:ribosomal protein L16 Arg81 hydroxylase
MFWSKAEAKAIIHYDSRDNIAVQLEGKKRWFISTEPAGLQNSWKQVGEPLPQLPNHRVVDAEPGDLIYIPRGTPHTVESTSESLHLAILFVPMTVREAISAALDYLSDFDRNLREPALAGTAELNRSELAERISQGLERLAEQVHTEDFLKNALDLHSSRMVSALNPLPRNPNAPQVTRETRVHHAPLAISHLRTALGSLDFTIPGEHIAIHPGVERELRFIADTAEFRVGEIPGQASDDVRIALVSRLVSSGLLEVAE